MAIKQEKKAELEERSYKCEVRAEEQDGTAIITGRPIVFNSRTDMGFFDEIIDPGALNNTDLTDVRFLVNHDLSRIPLARSRRNNGNSTMTLSVDAQGLYIRVVLDVENNAEARALYSAVKRGDISGMSFMFAVRGQEIRDEDTDHPLRIIKDISTVVEVSAVTFPAYPATDIDARSKAALDSVRSALESARQQKAKSLDSDLELARARYLYISNN